MQWEASAAAVCQWEAMRMSSTDDRKRKRERKRQKVHQHQNHHQLPKKETLLTLCTLARVESASTVNDREIFFSSSSSIFFLRR
jgi:hypothetical protein